MMRGDIIRSQVGLWTQHGLKLITAEAQQQEKKLNRSWSTALSFYLYLTEKLFLKGEKHLMNDLQPAPSDLDSIWQKTININVEQLKLCRTFAVFKSGNVWLKFDGNKLLTDCQKQQERPVWAERRRGRWFGCCSSRSGGSARRCRALVDCPATPLRCTPSTFPERGKTCCFWNADRGGSVGCAHLLKE